MYQNFLKWTAPSISAASYISVSIDCILARINRKDKGKYRQISNIVTIIRALGLWPKKLIGLFKTFICSNKLFTDPENGSKRFIHEKATAITGAT